jgi:hypothetical protein
MNTGDLVTHSGGLVARVKKYSLVLRELKAQDGAGNHVLLNLDEVGVGGRHSEDGVEMPIVLKEDSDSRPIVLVHTDAEMLFDRRLT